MAAALFRHHLASAGVAIGVESAGTLGWSGRPATAHAIDVLAARGVDLRGHVSRRLTRELLDEAELVIAMTRTHAWAVAARDEDAAARTFLLDELVRLAELAGPRGGEPLGGWVAELDARRPPERLARAYEEISDPAGEVIDVYRATADRLEHAVQRLVPLL